MSNYKNKNIKLQEEETEEQLEIFGRSKSREEIQAENKQRKAIEQEALREARVRIREKRKATLKSNWRELLALGIVLVAFLVGGGFAIAKSINKAKEEYKYEMSANTPGYFYDAEAVPELQDDGITAAVNQMYYTNGGHLCVYMTLGNGTSKAMRLDALQVNLMDQDTKELIAAGFSEEIADTYVVPAGGTNYYTFYISPEHVKLHEHSLESITYEITAYGTPVEE